MGVTPFPLMPQGPGSSDKMLPPNSKLAKLPPQIQSAFKSLTYKHMWFLGVHLDINHNNQILL